MNKKYISKNLHSHIHFKLDFQRIFPFLYLELSYLSLIHLPFPKWQMDLSLTAWPLTWHQQQKIWKVFSYLFCDPNYDLFYHLWVSVVFLCCQQVEICHWQALIQKCEVRQIWWPGDKDPWLKTSYRFCERQRSFSQTDMIVMDIENIMTAVQTDMCQAQTKPLPDTFMNSLYSFTKKLWWIWMEVLSSLI